MEVQVKSPAFEDGKEIPVKYSCTGDGVSPPIAWDTSGHRVESYAIIVEDPDAPMGIFTHWVVYDIPSNIHELPERVPNKDELPTGGVHGINSTHKSGYFGPCPPSGTHRYFFKVYALDKKLGLKPGVGKDQVQKAMEGHVVGEGQLMGTVSRH